MLSVFALQANPGPHIVMDVSNRPNSQFKSTRKNYCKYLHSRGLGACCPFLRACPGAEPPPAKKKETTPPLRDVAASNATSASFPQCSAVSGRGFRSSKLSWPSPRVAAMLRRTDASPDPERFNKAFRDRSTGPDDIRPFLWFYSFSWF